MYLWLISVVKHDKLLYLLNKISPFSQYKTQVLKFRRSVQFTEVRTPHRFLRAYRCSRYLYLTEGLAMSIHSQKSELIPIMVSKSALRRNWCTEYCFKGIALQSLSALTERIGQGASGFIARIGENSLQISWNSSKKYL